MSRNLEIITAEGVDQTLSQMAEKIYQDFQGKQLMLMGMETRGVPIAKRMAQRLKNMGLEVKVGSLDTTFYRDDYHFRKKLKNPSIQVTQIPEDNIDGMNIVLVDDVLYTGRSIRSALNALMDFGRPAQAFLAVLVDRGGREMPIEPKYTGLKFPTEEDEEIQVQMQEIDGITSVKVVPVEGE